MTDKSEALQQALAEPENFEQLRKTWILKQLRQRESQFTNNFNIKVLFSTWNVNMTRPPPTEELANIFLSCDEPPDVVAFGFQELDMTAEGLLLQETARAAPWIDGIRASLNYAGTKIIERIKSQQTSPQQNGETNSNNNTNNGTNNNVTVIAAGVPFTNPKKVEDLYELVHSRQLVGVLLNVYILKKHSKYVTEIQSNLVTTGILGIMGNKGGVGIRFKLHDSTFCIINAHFNAHQTNVQRRNQDYRDICTMLFNVDGFDLTIFDHDNIFWIGDLNYRIDLDDAVVKQKIIEKDWPYLFNADQLNVEMKKGNCFTDWEESPINFAPTYKYNAGTQEYDTSAKSRIPAWCDRVLWRPTPTTKHLAYQRHEFLQSDHRPVSSYFQVGVKSIVQSARAVVLNELNKEWDKMENDSIPDCRVSRMDCDFGQVRFGVPVTRSITLENTGKVVCRYRFIPKLNDNKPCRDWLHIHPPLGMLPPGEKLDINLTVHIQESTAPPFNLDREKVEDIIILHLENGKDYFITITGKYLRSSFGCRLEYLVRFQQPIRSSEPLSAKEPSTHLRIPKEIWRIVDYLYKNSMEEEDLFLETGATTEMENIREALDTGSEFPSPLNSHSMAETLLRFLESLEVPVIPFQLHRNVLDAAGNPLQAKQVIARLPEVYYNTFFYCMAFLREVLQFSTKNKLTPEKLAFVFSSVLIRPPPSTRQTDQNLKRQAAFIQTFLQTNDMQAALPPPKTLQPTQ